MAESDVWVLDTSSIFAALCDTSAPIDPSGVVKAIWLEISFAKEGSIDPNNKQRWLLADLLEAKAA